jgi:MFS family permease
LTLIGASFLAKVIALTFLGRLAPRVGTLRLLRWSAVALILIPALWIVIRTFPGLVALQLFAGVPWAAHEFASFLLFFDAIPRAERTSLLSILNLANATATLVGSLVGGALFGGALFGTGVLGGALPAGWQAYWILFGGSALLRLGAFFFLVPLAVGREPALRLSFRAIALNPSAGAVLRPIWASIERLTGEVPRSKGKQGPPRGGS